MNRRIALVLILILTASSLIVVKPTHSSITKPSVPEFTVKLVDSSYDVPTTYSTNPYTGEKVTHPGYRVESRTIEIKIKNQPFTPFVVEEATANWTVGLQYVIRWKGHYGQDWHEIHYSSGGFAGANLESEYTVISFEGEYSSSEGLKLIYQGMYTTFPPGAQIDFQVEAMIGYIHHVDAMPFSADVFEGETSGWSNTQILTINAHAPITTPNGGTASPDEGATSDDGLQQMEQLTAILGAVIIAIVSAALGLLLYFKKRQRSQSS